MFGIDDVWIWSAYLLCLLSTLGCVIYGILTWNRDGGTTSCAEDVLWQEEEAEIEEAL